MLIYKRIHPPYLGRFNLKDESNIVNYIAVSGSPFLPGGCIVNNIQRTNGMIPPGKNIGVPMIRDPFTAHQIKYMVEYFKNNR